MDSAIVPTGPLSGEVMFYKNPEPLNIESHAKLGLNPSTTPFAFAKAAHAVPLVISEFGPSSLHYPIIFAGRDFQPLAIMSVRADHNLFVGDAGVFEDGVYIPAFIRRYPFVLASGGPEEGQLVVCIDRGADIITENAEVPLFDKAEPSAFTRQCMNFCSEFEVERRKTDDFIKLMQDLDLFELRETNYTPRNPDRTVGEAIKVAEFYSPSEDKIKALSDQKLLNLVKSGAMQQITLHWNSLLNWERIVTETFKRDIAAPAAGNA
jgi:hypothetical protein